MGLGKDHLYHQVHQRAGGDAHDKQDLGRSQGERLLGSQARGIEQGASFVECEGLLGRTQVQGGIQVVVTGHALRRVDRARLTSPGTA